MLPRFLCFFSWAVLPSAAYARVTARDMYSLYGVASNSDSASFTLLFRLLKGSKTERTTLAAKLGSTERLLSLLLGPLTPRHSLSLAKLEINQKATVEQLCHVSFAPPPPPPMAVYQCFARTSSRSPSGVPSLCRWGCCCSSGIKRPSLSPRS